MKRSIAAEPGKPAAYLELAKLQEERDAIEEAEATLTAARAALPSDTAVLTAVSRVLQPARRFPANDRALEQIAALDPSDPSRHQMIATFYWEKAFKDKSLSPGDRLAYIQSGIAATDRAIALNADYLDAVTYKNILLRMQAQVETDPTRQQQLIAEAGSAQEQGDPASAKPVRARHAATSSTTAAAGRRHPDARPVRRAGPRARRREYQAPTKIERRPAGLSGGSEAAKVTGVVIIEATIDPAGHVSDTRVLRSVPLLDQAAVDAVKQWEFTPTSVNGVAVPVIMTVTVNFSLQ